MTWSRNFPSPDGETLQESIDKVDISDLKPQYQEQFAAATAALYRMLAVDEVPEGDLSISMTGYASPAYPPAIGEIRSISVQLMGAPTYVEAPSINTDDLGSGHTS